MRRTIILRAGAVAVALLVGPVSLAGCGLGARPEMRTIVVTIHYSQFGSSLLTVRPGETVRFVVRNSDPIDHEFILGDETVQHFHEAGSEPHHGAKPGEISIPAGQTRTTTFTFPRLGTLLFGCHLPGHYAYGMRGSVLIA